VAPFKKAHDPKSSSYCMVVARYAKYREQTRYAVFKKLIQSIAKGIKSLLFT
jgi:hypothetical protein